MYLLSVFAIMENKLSLSLSASVAAARTSSDGVAIRYVLRVLWMTSRLPITGGQAKATRILKVTHRDAARIRYVAPQSLKNVPGGTDVLEK